MSDPYEDEVQSIIDSCAEAGHIIPAAKLPALKDELYAILENAWQDCQQRVRDVAEEK